MTPASELFAIEREISLSNNATLIQSELILMFFISYDKRERCFCSLRAKTSHLTAPFSAVVSKRIWLRNLIVTNKYSWPNWDQGKSPDNRGPDNRGSTSMLLSVKRFQIQRQPFLVCRVKLTGPWGIEFKTTVRWNYICVLFLFPCNLHNLQASCNKQDFLLFCTFLLFCSFPQLLISNSSTSCINF